MDTSSEFSSRSRSTMEFLRRTVVYLRPYKWAAAGNIILAFLTIGFYFVFPYVTQYIIDTVIGGRKMDLLLPAALCLLGTFFLCEFCNALRIIVNTHFGQNVIFDMRRDVYARLQRLPVNFFDHRASGDLMTRVIDDVASVHRVLVDGVERTATTFLSIIVILIILLFKNVTLTMLALIPLAILVAGTLWYTLTAHRRYRKQREAIGAMNALLMDNLQGVRQIKAFGRQDHEDERFRERADGLRRSTLSVMKVWAAYSPAMTFAGSLGMVLVLWVGGPMVVDGTMTLGGLVGFIFYLTLFYQPIGRLDGLNQMLQSARAASDRVFDILDAGDEQQGRDRIALLKTPVRGEVRYDRVNFSYNGSGRTLKDISLHARPGEVIALVGPTGSGKSTLVNLLPAFYEAASGRIFIDSQDIAGVSLDSLRSRISVVSQEAFLFNGTVRENILYGRLDATGDQMLAASRAANCHEFIMSLPGGYDSRVGERGVKLSVGEKQRISIARALLKDAPILILDEATASVDTVTERLIQEALSRLMANRTSFVIAHRLGTIRNADQILVMHHGEIVERGNHEELLDLGGVYARLCLIQDMEEDDKGGVQKRTARNPE
ncbi:MAG: ABC transporter ATP-binding protein [Syntrophorhabdaceae bacterium]|nr:ABC transporter ATP-binding protein [Syntrophorhabdaceae bacterium]